VYGIHDDAYFTSTSVGVENPRYALVKHQGFITPIRIRVSSTDYGKCTMGNVTSTRLFYFVTMFLCERRSQGEWRRGRNASFTPSQALRLWLEHEERMVVAQKKRVCRVKGS
jgi:hypothetical protein